MPTKHPANVSENNILFLKSCCDSFQPKQTKISAKKLKCFTTILITFLAAVSAAAAAVVAVVAVVAVNSFQILAPKFENKFFFFSNKFFRSKTWCKITLKNLATVNHYWCTKTAPLVCDFICAREMNIFVLIKTLFFCLNEQLISHSLKPF